MQTHKRLWSGASDLSRKTPAEYFIPSDLQSSFTGLNDLLGPLVTSERMQRFNQVATHRSRRVLCVFEQTHHCHNISAVLRTIDAFGFQDAIFVYTDPPMRFRYNDGVERGSSTWLSCRRAAGVDLCAKALVQSGYKIALVSLPTFHRTAEHYEQSLPSFDCNEFASPAFANTLGDAPLALIFGNEKHGVSALWNSYANLYVHVGMQGFVESLNVSVCGGIILHGLRAALPSNTGNLTSNEKELLIEHWLTRSVDASQEIVTARAPELLPYYRFVASGGFFKPF